MEPIEFADGFDAPDRIAFGLTASQLVAVVGCAGLASMVLHSPLPAAVSIPPAILIAAAGAALGWLRIAGRPALDWVRFGLAWWTRPRAGRLVLSGAGTVPRELEPVASRSVVPLFRDASPAPRGTARCARRVTFFSLRGGTGRSTIATELACLLARPTQGTALRVALLDMDTRSATVSVRLGIPERTVVDFALAPADSRRVTDFLASHPSGVRVLLGPDGPDAARALTPAVLREVLRELDMDGFDVVVIDLPADLSPVTLAGLRACDDVFVVVVPTAGGIQDAYRTTASLRRLGIARRLRYIVNRTRGVTDVAEPMADLNGSIVAEIPDDDELIAAENRHDVVGAESPGPAAEALRRLASLVRLELPVR